MAQPQLPPMLFMPNPPPPGLSPNVMQSTPAPTPRPTPPPPQPPLQVKALQATHQSATRRSSSQQQCTTQQRLSLVKPMLRACTWCLQTPSSTHCCKDQSSHRQQQLMLPGTEWFLQQCPTCLQAAMQVWMYGMHGTPATPGGGLPAAWRVWALYHNGYHTLWYSNQTRQAVPPA